MKRTLLNRLKKSYFFAGAIVALLIFVAISQSFVQAAGGLYWDETIGMSELLETSANYTDGKVFTKDETIFLELDATERTPYKLYYYLESGHQTLVEFDQTADALNIDFYINENDGSNTFDYGNDVEDHIGFTPITEDLLASDYLEMNYDLTVPAWEEISNKTITTAGAISFTIPKSNSNAYPGVAFEIDNKLVFIRWDQQNKLVYFQTTGYVSGQLMPVRYETPTDGTSEIVILKQLEDFSVTPTHYINNDGVNEDVNPIYEPDDSIAPGEKPGMDITFKQPKEIDMTDWTYGYANDLSALQVYISLEDLGTGDNNQFDFGLNQGADPSLFNIANMSTNNSGINYSYSDNTYMIHLVKDKLGSVDPDTGAYIAGTALNDPDYFLEWSSLAASSVYDVTLTFQRPLTPESLKLQYSNYDLADIAPTQGFANTYMRYELVRSGANEGYLEVTPFNVGVMDEIEYLILNDSESKVPLDIRKDLWLQSYYSGDGSALVYIPIKPKSDQTQDSYQVVTVFNGKNIYSQVVTYEAAIDQSYPITIPSITEVDNVTVVPPLVIPEALEDYLPEYAEMDLVWVAPDNTGEIKELDEIFAKFNDENDHLYYELYVNQLPNNHVGKGYLYEMIQVFEVTKVGDTYQVDLVVPGSNSAIPSDKTPFDLGYDEDGNQFRVNNINLRDEDGWARVITVDNNGDYTLEDVEANFLFEGVNYLSMRAVTVIDDEVERTDASIPASLSLSMSIVSVPIVDGLDYEPVIGNEGSNNAGVLLDWIGVNENTYLEKMLTPVGQTIESMAYRIYIAEESVDMDPLFSDANLMEAMVLDSSNYGTDRIEVGQADKSVDYIKFDTTYINDLRDKQIVYFDLPDDGGTYYDLALLGLDRNQNYKIRVVTQIYASGESDPRLSEPSDVLSVLVPQTPGEPGEDENNPLAPENLTVEEEPEDSNIALLQWSVPEAMLFAEDGIGFEIVAIEDVAMPATVLSDNSLTVKDILENSLPSDVEREGWKLYFNNNTTVLTKMVLDTNGMVTEEAMVVPEDTVSEDLLSFMLEDDNNGPNRVNYYYVRTVNMDGETAGTASIWVPGTLTTSQVKSPINLAIEYESVTYDGKNQAVLRFDLPITDVDLIPGSYAVEIHVKGEDDEGYAYTKYASRLMDSNEEAVTGYTRVYYRVSDLEPGTTYAFKVLLQDKTQPAESDPNGNKDWPRSAFSNIVTTRTDFDQENYDKENKYNQYLTYYRDKAEDLMKDPYFVIESTSSKMSVKYRESYTDGLLKRYSNNEFYLYTEDKDNAVYYIPSTTLEDINDKEITLIVMNKGQEIRIRPDTVGSRLTDEIDDVIDDINSYDDDTEDYYFVIEVTIKEDSSKINGYSASSPKVTVELGVIASEYVEASMDDQLVSEMNASIEDNVSRVIDQLEDSLEDEIDEEDLLEIVQDVLEDVQEDFTEEAEDLFDDHTDSVDWIDEVDEPLLIGLMADDPTSTQYTYELDNKSWRFVTNSYFSRRYHVESTNLNPLMMISGSTGQSNLGNTYGQDGVDVINTFNLGSIFTTYDFENDQKLISKEQWYEAVVKVLGGDNSGSPVDDLEDFGIIVDNDSMTGTIAYDAALALYAKAYAIRYNIDLSHANITDYYSIEDIEDVDPKYQQTLLRAVSAGIIRTDSGFIDPEHETTMADVMALLTNLFLGND